MTSLSSRRLNSASPSRWKKEGDGLAELLLEQGVGVDHAQPESLRHRLGGPGLAPAAMNPMKTIAWCELGGLPTSAIRSAPCRRRAPRARRRCGPRRTSPGRHPPAPAAIAQHDRRRGTTVESVRSHRLRGLHRLGVDRAEWLGHRRDRLDRRLDHQRLAVGHSARGLPRGWSPGTSRAPRTRRSRRAPGARLPRHLPGLAERHP